MSSVGALDFQRESFMQLGIYLHRTSAVIMELQNIERSPPSIEEFLKSLSEKVDHAKNLLARSKERANMADEAIDVVRQLETDIRDIGEDLNKIPSSIFEDRTYAEIAVRSLSKEMKNTSLYAKGIQQHIIDSSGLGIPSISQIEETDKFILGIPSASLVENRLEDTASIASSSKMNRRDNSQFGDMLGAAGFVKDLHSNSSGYGTEMLYTPPRLAEYLEPVYTAFFCPLTKKIMEDPVIIESGATYEREAIAKLLEDSINSSGALICPVTEKPLQNTALVPNLALKNTIEEWSSRNEFTRIKVARINLSLASSDVMIMEAIRDLQLLAQKRDQNKRQMHEIGVTTLIVNCLDHQDRKLRCEALNLLHLLVEDDDEGKAIMAKTKALRRMAKMLSSKYSAEILQSVSLLLELSKSEALLNPIGSTAGCVLMLITMMYNKSTDEVAAVKAEETLKNLEKIPRNIKIMADNGFLQPLLDHLADGSEEVQLEMVSYLSEVFLPHDMKSYVAKKVSRALVKMASNDKPFIQKAAFKSLLQLSSDHSNSGILVDAGVVPIMIEQMFTRSLDDELINVKEEAAAAIIANLIESELDLETIKVNKHGHSITSHYFIYNTAHLLKASMSDKLSMNLVKILLSLTKIHKHKPTNVSVIKETEVCPKIVELLSSPLDALNIVAVELLIALSSHMGHTIAEELCKYPGQPGKLITGYSTLEIDEKHAFFVNLLVQLPHQNLTLNQALLHQGTVRVILSRIQEIVKGETKATRYTRYYLEGLVGILVRFTTTLMDQEIFQMAMEGNLAPVFSELLTRTTGSDEVQRLAASGLANLSSITVNLSKPLPLTELKQTRSRGFLNRNTSKDRKAPPARCPVHRGLCSPSTTFCLWESKAVEGLLGCLENDNPKVVDSGLAAISTLLDERVDVEKSVEMLCEAGAVRRVLKVLREHREQEELLERSLWLIYTFLRNGEERCSREILNDKMIHHAVINAFHRSNSETKQIASDILRYMNRMPQMSQIFSFE